MQKSFVVTALFLVQVYLVVAGVGAFGKDINPFILFAVSIAIPIYFFKTHISGPQVTEKASFKHIAGGIIGLVAIMVCFWAIRRLWWDIPNPGDSSDVIPQIDALYTRFARGEFPYRSLEQFPWHPYPVYMPLHWLPVSIPYALDINIRWIGVFFLALANGLYGMMIWKYPGTAIRKAFIIFLPSVVLWGYLALARFDLAVSFETIIAAYYLVLAAGLTGKNLFLTTTGIILCLLSRYTMVFWMPLFAILLWMNVSKKKNLLVWLSIILAFVFIYIIPFYVKDPTVLSKGLSYHNGCAVAEWVGYGNPPVSWTFEGGVYFGHYLRGLFSGDMEHRVFLARILQAVLMIALVCTGLLLYRKWKHKMDMYDLNLLMLYTFVLFFYMFGVLTYRYYYIPLLTLSAVLCGKVLLANSKAKNSKVKTSSLW